MVGKLPQTYIPDRDIILNIHISKGFLICSIKKTGKIIISSKNYYKANSIISLSNIRYPLYKGESLQKESNISYTNLNGLVFISGITKLYKGCFKDCKGRDLPKFIGNYDIEGCKNKAIENGLKYYGLQYQNGIGKGNRPLGQCWLGNSFGSQGKTNNCKKIGLEVYGQSCSNAVYKVMAKLNENIDPKRKLYFSVVNDIENLTKVSIQNKTIKINSGTQNVSLEGIHWSLFNGEKLKLKNNYKIVNESTRPCVILHNNIVKLTGNLIKYYRINNNNMPEIISNLEKKYRPDKTLIFLCYSNEGTVNIKIKNNGDIIWMGNNYGKNINNEFSLDNIIFIK